MVVEQKHGFPITQCFIGRVRKVSFSGQQHTHAHRHTQTLQDARMVGSKGFLGPVAFWSDVAGLVVAGVTASLNLRGFRGEKPN